MNGMADHLNDLKRRGRLRRGKVQKVMDEWKGGTLHSGSKTGPLVTNRKQAIAIALSEQRKQDRGGYR